MLAMRMTGVGAPLEATDLPNPVAGAGEVRIRVRACAVCRTDLHVVNGDLPVLRSPLTPGHEIVGVVDAVGLGVTTLEAGQRVGAGWLGGACDRCTYCTDGRENLCDAPIFTGYSRDGGFAEYVTVDARYAYPVPSTGGDDAELAPLMCAGLIGWRSLVAAGEGRRLGLYGFGAAAHIIAQVAKWEGREVYAFTRAGDSESQAFAQSLGVDWVGSSSEVPPEALDAAIIYAPVGALVPAALRAVRKGGRVVCAGIHMSDIPSFPYEVLWGERSVVSVANLTRRDAHDFLALAPRIGIRTHVVQYPLSKAQLALSDLSAGRLQGAAVLIP